MNEFVSKICPFCKSEFKENDEVVVCSTCDMPHHKECWIENQGCTTFGCLGTIKSAERSTGNDTTNQNEKENTSAKDVIYCTNCGKQHSSANKYCSNCGNKLHEIDNTHNTHTTQKNTATNNSYSSSYNNEAQNYTRQTDYSQNTYGNSYNQQTYTNQYMDSEATIYIGPKSEYYISKFNNMKMMNKNTSWNWCAFLVTPYWFIYRKMYGYGAGILGITFFLTLLDNELISLLILAGYIAFGIFGNYIYMQQIEKYVAQGKTIHEPYKSQFVMKSSGVNPTATTLTIVGYIILMIILLY